MVNFSKATLLFAIGYVTAVGIATILLPIQPALRILIVFGTVQLVFTELHYFYLTKSKIEIDKSLQEVLKVGLYWSVLTFILDFMLFSIIVPYLIGGRLELAFIANQPFLYWLQFPMLVVTGIIARITYIKVFKIQAEAAQKEEVLIQ